MRAKGMTLRGMKFATTSRVSFVGIIETIIIATIFTLGTLAIYVNSHPQ
jgi:hypothetical protein